MACARSCGFLFRLAVANNVERYSIARRLNVNLIASSPSKFIFRNLRGRVNPNLKRDESSENSEIVDSRTEESSSIALTDRTTSEIELMEEEIKSVEGVLNKINASKDVLNVDNSIYYLRKLVGCYNKKNTNLSLKEIQNSKELFLLLKTYQMHLGTIHADNLVQILDSLSKLGIPDRAVIMLQILRILKEDFNNLSFREANFLFRYVKNVTKNADANAIKIALKEALPLKFKETFDKGSKFEVKKALYFLIESPDVLAPCAIEICNAVVQMCESEDDDFSRDVIVGLLRALKVIDKKDPRFKKISLTSFNIVKKIALMDLPMRGVHLVLNNYAFLATGKIMEYDEVIVNNLGKKVIESDVFPCKKFIIFDGMIKMGHNQIEVADYFADLVIADPGLLMDHNCTHKFIRFLFNTNFKNLRKDKWEKLEPIIKNLPILTDESRWHNFSVTDLVIDLIGLGIFPDYMLRLLSEKYNSEILLKENYPKIKVMIAINQAVKLWHPNFGEPVLSKETISFIIQYYKQRLIEAKAWPSEVKTFLEEATGVKDSVLLNCYSSTGFLVKEVMVLNKKNIPIPLTGLSEELVSVDHLRSRFQSEKLVLLLNFGVKSYSVNTRNLFSLASITVKALEKQGFFVIPILENDWFELDERERGVYLWKCIQERMPDSWKRPTTLDKVSEASEKIKDAVVSNAKKITNFSNFFHR